jgi:hypothetical protein
MSTLTEGQHTAAFVASTANGDRSFASVTVKSGGKLTDGQLYSVDGDEKAIPFADGATVAGISLGDFDATAADVSGVGVVRDATVKKSKLTVFDGATAAQITTAMTGLEALGIIARD